MRLLLWFTAVALAQPPAPHAGYVYPAGGRQGATFEVTVGGQNLNNANNAYLSGDGVRVTVLEYKRPMTGAQANMLREQMQALNKKRTETPAAFTAEDRAKMLLLRDKLAKFIPRPQNLSIAEMVTVKVEIAADAALGDRELRLATPAGLSNPVVFCIGKLPEIARSPADPSTAPGATGGRVQPALSTATTPPVEITLPVTLNGQIMPGAVDRYRFHASKGLHLVAAAGARELIPYISDAVPGWFQASLTLRDAAGHELRRADHYRFHPDPVLEYEIPADGAYTIEIHDSIFRGREDFVYRLSIGELPFVSALFPLGARRGARTAVQLSGWNLPARRLTPDTKGKGGIERIGVAGSNTMPFLVDDLPEAVEKEPNDRRQSAQRVRLPVIVNGRIDRPGDADWFRFDARAGEEIVLEVMARRLDSPVDSILRLINAAGKELAANDDFDDKSDALATHHADSYVAVKLPAKGTYYAVISDAQKGGGPELWLPPPH